MRVEEIMVPEIATVNDFDLLENVVSLLFRRNLSEVPVVDLEENVVGYFSIDSFLNFTLERIRKESFEETEVISLLEKYVGENGSREISDFMEEKFDYLEVDDEVIDVLDVLTVGKSKTIPVLKGKKVVGKISTPIFLKFLMDKNTSKEVKGNE